MLLLLKNWVSPYKKNPMFTRIRLILSQCKAIFFHTRYSLSLLSFTGMALFGFVGQISIRKEEGNMGKWGIFTV
jgi:hypothetical protein